MFWLIALSAALIAAAVFVYNRLIRYRNRVSTAWSDIDVQLQRRHDLVPRLVTAVKGYAAYEKATLEAVTELRVEAMRRTAVASRGEAEEQLGQGISRLIALAENYPDLKANETFRHLQKELVETANGLRGGGVTKVSNTALGYEVVRKGACGTRAKPRGPVSAE